MLASLWRDEKTEAASRVELDVLDLHPFTYSSCTRFMRPESLDLENGGFTRSQPRRSRGYFQLE